jgi:hypothetical protein
MTTKGRSEITGRAQNKHDRPRADELGPGQRMPVPMNPPFEASLDRTNLRSRLGGTVARILNMTG